MEGFSISDAANESTRNSKLEMIGGQNGNPKPMFSPTFSTTLQLAFQSCQIRKQSNGCRFQRPDIYKGAQLLKKIS